jgi:hypothetical protein
VAGSWEQSNEAPGVIKFVEFLDQLRDC